jgi:DNA-binding YbaB/EbfC family protein
MNPKNIGQMVKQAQQLQQQMGQIEEKLKSMRFDASAGGGAVQATVDGRQRLVGLKITPESLKSGDAELLEDLVLAAVHEAQARAEENLKQALGPLTGNMKLPF